MKKLSVLAIPAKENKKDNPYNYILYSNVEKLGINVSGYSFSRFLNVRSYDVVHFHWPENYLNGKSGFRATKELLVFFAKMAMLKLCGRKVVWTVHNFSPHESNAPFHSKLLYRLLYKRMDGFISLTEHGQKEIVSSKSVPQGKTMVIPHPHYVGYYPNTCSKEKAREALDIPQDKFVFLFVGQVRAYKNVTGLVDAFRQMNDENAVLVIAGKVHEDVAEELLQKADGVSNILLFPQFVEDEDLQLFLNSADLVVNPFQKILNSGSVFLNLSFSRPTLVPSTESLRELRRQAGPAWIKVYEGTLSADHLRNYMKEIKQENRNGTPNLKPFDWNLIAQQTKTFYEKVLAQ